MNPSACTDIRKIELLSVHTVTAMEELINGGVRPGLPFGGQCAADHSIAASPITGQSLVFGPDVKRERSESRSDAEGAR